MKLMPLMALPDGTHTWRVIVAPAGTVTLFKYTSDVPPAVPLKLIASDWLPAKCCVVEVARPVIEPPLLSVQRCGAVSKLYFDESGVTHGVAAWASAEYPDDPE